MGRPTEFAPGFGTGLATFLLLLVIVTVGILMRFGIVSRKRESWHLIHVGFALSFFIVVIIHILKILDFYKPSRAAMTTTVISLIHCNHFPKAFSFQA